MKLSIIIPAYNVEQYLERCVESCEDQDIPHNEYELIVVDDGSTDSTLQVANELAGKYGNITVLTQKNQGQSVARNYGMEEAKGEYIWFVDSDDYIECNCMKGLLKKSKMNRLDILSFHMKLTQDGSTMLDLEKQSGPSENVVYAQGEPYYHGFVPGTICSRLFRRIFVIDNNLRFVPNLIHQDSEFSMRAMALAKRSMFIDTFAYIYFRHANTTTTSTNLKKVVKREVDNVRIAVMLNDFAVQQKSKGMDVELVSLLEKKSRSMLFGAVMALWKKRKEWGRNGVNAMILDQLRELGQYPLRGPYNSWKQKLFAMCILNHPSLLC